jgi:hypothetical protein
MDCGRHAGFNLAKSHPGKNQKKGIKKTLEKDNKLIIIPSMFTCMGTITCWGSAQERGGRLVPSWVPDPIEI